MQTFITKFLRLTTISNIYNKILNYEIFYKRKIPKKTIY